LLEGGLIAASHHHCQALPEQLAARFEAEAAIRTGHERNARSRRHGGF
jgi:hypothetical protein